MNLYLIEQNKNYDDDTYDSAVVCAESEKAAKLIYPGIYQDDLEWDKSDDWRSWALPKNITVKLIGTVDKSIKPGIIYASFNAE